jgi:hypothetical protein
MEMENIIDFTRSCKKTLLTKIKFKGLLQAMAASEKEGERTRVTQQQAKIKREREREKNRERERGCQEHLY